MLKISNDSLVDTNPVRPESPFDLSQIDLPKTEMQVTKEPGGGGKGPKKKPSKKTRGDQKQGREGQDQNKELGNRGDERQNGEW